MMFPELNSSQQLLEQLKTASIAAEDPLRTQLLDQARKLCARLETPYESTTRMVVTEPAANAAVKVALECGLFDALGGVDTPGKTANGESSKESTEEQLIQNTKAEPALVRRLLRLLASMQIVEEVAGTDRYRATPFSRALTERKFISGFRHYYATIQPVIAKLPFYLEENSFQMPRDPNKGPFQYGQQTSSPLWSWYKENPKYATYFNEWMSATHALNHASWIDTFPTAKLLEPSEKEDMSTRPLVVDVGGGMGKDLDELRQSLPSNNQYELVVQDQQSVVDQAKSSRPHLTYMAHDFFEEQPVRHARAYLIKSTLHNWSDDDARRILSALKPAFQPGYSVLLLSEPIMPARDTPRIQASVDVVMMALLCGQSRTQRDWENLLESAGFKTKKIWGSAQGSGPIVIEAEPVE